MATSADPSQSASRPEPRRLWPTLGWILLALAVLGIAFRLALTPVVASVLRQRLADLPGYRGTFDRLSLSVLGLSGRIEGLELRQDPDRGHPPLATVPSVEGKLLWKELLHLRLVAEVRVDEPKAKVVIESREQLLRAIHTAEEFATRHLGPLLARLAAFKVSRVEVRNAELLLIDQTEKGVPQASAEVWVHGIEATVENFGDRRDLIAGRPTTLAVRAQVQRSGETRFFLTADPLADQLDFLCELTLRHLQLRELYGFIEPQTKLQATAGTLDAFVTLRVHKGQLQGAVKPLVENVKLASADGKVATKVEALLANGGAGVASDRVPNRQAIGTVIDVSGPVTAPKADLWPAVWEVLGNAYKAALAPKAPSAPAPSAPVGGQAKP